MVPPLGVRPYSSSETQSRFRLLLSQTSYLHTSTNQRTGIAIPNPTHKHQSENWNCYSQLNTHLSKRAEGPGGGLGAHRKRNGPSVGPAARGTPNPRSAFSASFPSSSPKTKAKSQAPRKPRGRENEPPASRLRDAEKTIRPTQPTRAKSKRKWPISR